VTPPAGGGRDGVVEIGAPDTLRPGQEDEVCRRALTEFCLPVTEDYGWREWLWFPGLTASAFAHWWVTSATRRLRGDFFPAHGRVGDTWHKLNREPEAMGAHVECDVDSYLFLGKSYRATLVPRFGRNTAEESTFCPEGLTPRHVVARWRESILVAARTRPKDYLSDLKLRLAEIDWHGFPSEPKQIDLWQSEGYDPQFEPFGNRQRGKVLKRGVSAMRRNWSTLGQQRSLADIPARLHRLVFDRQTEFWDVDGVPVICHGDARCIDARTGQPIGLSRRIVSAEEGRCMSAAEFLFVLQLTPGNVYMDIEPDPECPKLPAVIPGHYTLWEFRGQPVVCSPKGFARGSPDGGYVWAKQVEMEGLRLDEQQFRDLAGRSCGLMA
jgi:hypothetical protein